MADQFVHEDDTWDRPAAAPTKAAVAGWPYPQYAQAEPVYHRGSAFPGQDWPYPQKTAEGNSYQYAFNDGHYHSPRTVEDRPAKAPTGPPVANWPETSPPKDEEKKDDKKEEAKKSLAQIQDEPEKVHTLMPEGHQAVANSNQPGPRTTFYAEHI
jgi:hypothetical protein